MGFPTEAKGAGLEVRTQVGTGKVTETAAIKKDDPSLGDWVKGPSQVYAEPRTWTSPGQGQECV